MWKEVWNSLGRTDGRDPIIQQSLRRRKLRKKDNKEGRNFRDFVCLTFREGESESKSREEKLSKISKKRE